MALLWGLAFPLPTHLSLMLFGFLVCGIWVLFSRNQSQTQVAAKTQASKQQNRSLRQIRKLTVSQLEETETNVSTDDLTSISGLPTDRTQEYVFWSIDRSLRQICQHLDNARSTLMEMNLSESRDMSSSCVSDIVVQEVVPPGCYCKKGKPSTDYNMSSASSKNSSSLSHLPFFPEGPAWQFQSDSVSVSSQKEPSMPWSHGTSLPTSQLTDPEKSDLSQNLAVLPPFLPLQLSPLIRGQPEGHRSQKVSTLEQQVVPLPVKQSWDLLSQSQKAPLTNVELTPKFPRSATDSIKVTPLALLQVMDLMGIIPESQSEVIDSVGFSPQPPNQAETVSITPQPTNQIIAPIKVTSPQHQMTELKSMASGLSQVTDDMKVTPVALFHVMDSMGLIDKLSPHVIEPAGIAPKPQYHVMESVKTDSLHNYQAIRPGKMSLEPQQTVVEAVEMIPEPQHKDMGTLTMTLGSQNQARKHIRMTPSPIHQNAMEISSGALPEAIDDTKVTPVAKQGMDFMQIIPLGQPHITKSRALIQGSKTPAENWTPGSAQPDVPTSTVPVGIVESRSVSPQPPSKVLEPSGMIDDILLSRQSLHALKVTPIVQASPTGMITAPQVVEPHVKESLQLPSGLQGQVEDSMETMPQPQGTECVSLTPQSHHQLMGSMRTIPAPPHQGTVPIGRNKKHQVTEAEMVPAIPLLQEMEYLGGSTILQPKVMDSVDLLQELQNAKSEHLLPDPKLQSMKSVYITTDLVPEMEKYGLLTSTVVSTDLAPELHQQNTQYEELTPIPQLQSEIFVPSAPESQFPDVKSGQLTIEPQLQNIKSAGLAPGPQLQSNKSVHFIDNSQFQGIEEALSALSQELQGDIKLVELTPIPSLEDIKSVNLAPEPCSQSTGSDKIAPVPLLEDTKTPSIEGRSLIPEALVESMEVGELIPSTHFYATKSLEASPKPSYHFLEPEGLTLQHPDSEARVTSEPCLQVEESALLTQSSLGMTPAPWSQTSESMEMSSPPHQDTLETGTQVVKEMEETPESGSSIQDTLDLLLESEVLNMSSGVMSPEPQPPDVKFVHEFVHVTLEPGSEVNNPSEITLNPEYEDTETFRLTFSKVDDTQGTIVDLYSEVRSLEFSLEPGVHGEKSESFAQNLKSAEVIAEPPVQVVQPTELTTRPKPHIKDVNPGPQLHKVKSRQMDRESQLQNENTVNVIQLSSVGEVDSEKTKPEPGLQSLSLKELIEGTQPPNVKSVDLNLGPQHLSVKSELIPGPQLQSVQFSKLRQRLLQGENPVNFISGPPHYGVQSDEEISCSPGPEIRSSDFILGPKPPEPQPQPQPAKSVDVNIRPCLQHVRFSDPIAEPKDQDFKHVQFMPGIQLQDRKPQGLVPESLLPLSQETQVEDKKHGLPPEVSEFCSKKFIIPASELQYPSMIAEEVNPGLWQQDTKFSAQASRLKFPGVRFGEKTPGSLSHGMSPLAPELGIHDPKSAKVTPGLQDIRQVSFNSGPWQQDVKFLDVIPGTQPQDVKTSELNPGPQVECVKIFELTTQPERQGMKPELVVQEPLFEDINGNQVPSFEDKMSYKLASEPQIPNAESMKLTPGKHLAGADQSELIRRPQAQGVEPSELIHRQHLGHLKPVEKTTASNREELMPRPHLEDMKSLELRSKSELGKVKSMLSTPGIAAGEKQREELPPGSNLKGLKSELPTSGPHIKERKSAVLTLGQCLERIKSTVISSSSSQSDGMKSVKLIPGSRIEDLKTVGLARDAHVQEVDAMGLELEPKKQGESLVTFAPGMQDKPIEVLQGPHLQDVKLKELTSRPQMQNSKRVIIPCVKQHSQKPVNTAKIQWIHGVKFADLVSTQQYQERAPMGLTLKPGQDDQLSSAEWKGGLFGQLNKQLESEDMLPVGSNQEPKPADRKPIELISKVQCKDAPSFELAPETVVHNVKAQDVQYGPHVPSMEPCPLTPGSQVYQGKALEPVLEPPLQDEKTMALNPEPQSGSTKSVQWIPISEFQREKCIGSNFRLPSQSARPTELKLSTQRKSVRSKIQGEKPREFHLETQLQQVKASPLAPGLQKTTFNLTSEPQPQGLKTVELNKEPQVESVRSIQWIPRPEFHGVTFLPLNSGPPSPGVQSTERKPSKQLGGVKTSEVALGPKPQGKKSVDFNLGSQVQCVKTPELSPEPELQKGEIITPTSELQSQCVKSEALHQGPQLENTKSVLWIPLSEYQGKKSTLNLRLPSQNITAKELKPSVQLRDVKTSDELTSRPKSQSKQPLGSTQEHQSQRSKTIDFKSEQQFRSKKACDPTLRSKINNIKLAFKPRFCLEDRSSPGLNPGIQPQEGKPLGSSPGTQPGAETTSVYKQESQSSEVKCGTLSQRPQSQNNRELICGKSSDLALQTKPRHVKSENSSGPQWQCAKCSDLTPETESQTTKCPKLSSSSQLKAQPLTELATGTKTRRVQLGCKPGPQWQGIKANSFLRTKPQEMEMGDCESGPQLQDLKSSRTIMGIKVHDVMSVDSGPGPHLQGMTSEVITGKRAHGMKSVEIKHSSKSQGKKHDFTSRKMFLGTKSVELDSGPPLQDLKYPELIMGMKFQGVNSMRQQDTSIKSSEVVTQIKPQGVKAVDLNSGPQTQNKKLSELAHGQRFHHKQSVEFNQGPKLQGVTVESKPPNGESGKLNSGPQLQDEKYFKSILGTKLQYGRSMDVSPGLCSHAMKSSEVISEDTLQKEKPEGCVDQPLWQDVKSLKWMFSKTLDREPVQLETAQLQDRILSMITPELHLQGMKPEAVNCGSKLKGVKSEPTYVQTRKNTGTNHGAESQFVGFSKQASESTVYSVVPSEHNARNQKQDRKSHKLGQKQQLKKIKPIAFSHEPHLLHIKSSESCAKLQDLKSMGSNSEQQLQDLMSSELGLGTSLQALEFNPGPQLQEIKSSKVCIETKLADEPSLEFKHEPRLQGRASCDPSAGPQIHCKNVMASNTGTQNVELSALHPGPDLQGTKSKVLCLGPQSEDVNSACTPNANSQYIHSSGCKPGPYLQDIKASPWIPEPDPQCTKSVCNPGLHLHGMSSSACTLGPKLQCVASPGCIPEPNWQDVNSSVCTPGPSPHCMNSSVCIPGPRPQFVNCSVCTPRQSPQCVNSSVCTSGPSPQCVNSSACSSETSHQCVNSSVCTSGPSPQCVNSSACSSETSHQCVNSSACSPETSPQCANSSVCTSGPSPQCVHSFACSPETSPQCVNSSACSSETSHQCVNSSACSPGQSPQCVNSSVCSPGQSPQCANSSVCSPGQSPQCANSSVCSPGQSPQCANSSVCSPGPSPQCSTSSVCFPGPSPQCVDSSACSPETSHQCVHSSACSQGPSPPCVNSTEYHPETHFQGVNQWASILGPQIECVDSTGCNPKSHFQGVNLSSSTPGQNPQCEHSNRCSLEPLLGMNPGKTFPAPQIMCVSPVWCNTKTHLQDVDSSACPRRQESQSVNSPGCNPGPHLQALKFQGVKFSESIPGTRMQREMPIIVNQGRHVQDFKLESTPRSNIIDVAPVDYNPGPEVQPVKFSELNPGLKLRCINPVKLSSGPQLQNVKSFELTPESESQGQKSVLLNSGPPFQGVTSSHLMVGAEFQEFPFVKDQLGSWQQNSKPMFTLRPLPNRVKSLGVLPTPLPEDRMSPEMSKQPLLCFTNSVKVTPGCTLQDLRSTEFSPEPCVQKVGCVKLKPGSPTQSVNPLEFAPCHCSQHTKTSSAPKPCFHERKPMYPRLGSQQQSMDRQQFPSDEKPLVSTPESTRKFLAGPALTSVRFSNLIPESEQQCMKSMEITSEQKWQSVKHVKLSSVSLLQTGNSVELSPRPFLQNVTPGNPNPQARDQITESSPVIYRPGHQLVDYAEKMGHQVSKLVDFISLPCYQDVGSSEMTKRLGHKSPETIEKSMRLTPKPTDKEVIESLGMPQQLDLQVPESVDLTPTLSDQDSKTSELSPQKRYGSPETLQLLSCSQPEFKDYKELPTGQGSNRMTLDLKNHVAEVRMLTCEVRPEKEFLRVASKPVNRESGCVEKSPRPCPQDIGPVVVSSGKRSQREQSVASPPRPSYHVPDSASGITPGQGPQIPESVSLTSKPWLQIEESLELSTQQASQVVGDVNPEELTFESWQPGEGAGRLTKPWDASMGTLNITPIESLDQMINFITISPKPLDQMTESAKTRLHGSQSAALPKVSESVEVISGPPLQVIESVMIPEPASQRSKHADLTPKLHDVIMSEFASSLWLQNMQSKKLISAPTHQILEIIELSGFAVIKTILAPKPLLLIVKSEELTPGPNPQTIEPIGAAIKVMDGLNLLPRPHLQDTVKPMERTPRANSQENSAELILQQTSPLEEPPVVTHKQRLQAEKSLGNKTESPKVMEIEDLNQRRVCEDRDSEMITSEKLQAQNYFSRFIRSPSIPFIESSVKTTELWPPQGTGMEEVSRALAMKNFAVGILPSPESYTDTIMFHSSALPLVLPSDIGNTVGTLYPDIWEVDVLSKVATEKKQAEEFGNSFQSYSPYPLRLLPSEFQAGLGARRNSLRSFLGRQQNVWESHVCRQRLPRKYLSNMLMLGNVLGTTMERKLCSQPFLTEGAMMDICQFIQSLFGVPAELMAFSQSLLERGPRTISQTSVVKNYIQRHILCHGHEKRMPLKMWTRGSTSSIIQQYSGIKKTNSKLSDIFQEVTQHVSVSCTRDQFPALPKPESSLKILYNREDPVSRDQSENSQSHSPTRTFQSHHSLKASCLSQAKRDTSEQLHLLKDLQLKIAAKLLESQVPHNVPPPFSSGLVLKYPICLQCGRCSGTDCCHKVQSAVGPYLLVYPQIHLVSTPEGHGEIRLHLGFRLRTGKRPQVSKHRGRNRADTRKTTTSPSRRKAKIYPPASKSPTTPGDFWSRSSQAPASVQGHIRKKQCGSHGVVGKTDAKDSEHHEFCQVHSVSESGFESNQDEKWTTSSLKKTFGLKYPTNETTKGLKPQNTKLYKNSGTSEESPFRMMCPSRTKSIQTVQTNTVSSKRQTKKSSQPKFIQQLFQGLRQAFQIAHRVVAFTGQKPEDRTRPDNLWSTRYLHPKQKAKDYCLAGDSKRASTPVAQQRSTGVNPSQEDRLQGTGDQCRQTQQPNQVSSLQPRPLQLKTMASEQDATIQCTSTNESLSERRYHNPSQRRHSSPSDRTLRHLSERGLHSPSQSQDSSPSVKTLQSLSDWSHYSLLKGRGGSPSGRSRPSPGRRPWNPSRRSLSPPERRQHRPSKRSHLSPIQRTRGSSSESHGSLAERTPSSPAGRTRHNLSGRVHHRPSEFRLYRSSSRLHRSHSQRTHYSPSETRHSYSERSRQGHNEGPHHSTRERLGVKERPKQLVYKDLKTNKLLGTYAS